MTSKSPGQCGTGAPNYVEQFRQAMIAAGMKYPPTTIPLGEFVNGFPGIDRDIDDQHGYCKLNADGRSGCFGDYGNEHAIIWKTKYAAPPTEVERNEADRAVAKELQAREAKYADVAIKAQTIKKCHEKYKASFEHPYLKKKGIAPHGTYIYHGDGNTFIGKDESEEDIYAPLAGALMVPMYYNRELVNWQFILRVNGEWIKRFMPGGRVTGTYFGVGYDKFDSNYQAVFAEGFATAASIYEATVIPTFSCFDAKNLVTVAKEFRSQNPDTPMILAADDDYKNETNIGMIKATAAAKAVGGLLALPDFSGRKKSEAGASDFNDQHKSRGADSVKHSILAAKPVEPVKVDALDLQTMRRETQRQENERISNPVPTPPKGEIPTLEEMQGRFVWLRQGSNVVDLLTPKRILKKVDFDATYSGSFVEVKQQPVILTDGSVRTPPPKYIPTTKLWLQDATNRISVDTRTWKAEGGMFIHDPDNLPSVNIWTPIERDLTRFDLRKSNVGIFTDHVEFLFQKDAGAILDWLAHIEQNPGTLPQTSWLHVATHTGIGRNALASILVRVWPGLVAPNTDLIRILDTSFNAELAGKYLMVVDEIREGNAESKWRHSEKLKSLVNEEFKTVNRKFQSPYQEWNAMRTLIFSNHTNAFPLTADDRRFNVCVNDEKPLPEGYYVKLFAAINDPCFIAGVAQLLATRNISHFKPGARAVLSESKLRVIGSSESDAAKMCKTLKEYWPASLIKSDHLYYLLGCDGTLTAHLRHTLEEENIIAMKRPARVGTDTFRFYIIDDHSKWMDGATGKQVTTELNKIKIKLFKEVINWTKGGGKAPLTLVSIDYLKASDNDIGKFINEIQAGFEKG